MKHSIAFKTALSVLLAMIVVGSAVVFYVYKNQSEIVKELENENKATITKYILQKEKEDIKKTKEYLLNLARTITSGLANALYNGDYDSAKEIVKNLLKNESIKAVTVYDSGFKTVFLAGYKKSYKLIFTSKLPKYFNIFKKFKFDLVIDGQKIGYFTIYYSLDNIIYKIKKLKQQELALYQKKLQIINHKIEEKLYKNIIAFVIGGLIITIIIALLIKKFINTPLKEFKKGLESFFNYLKDPTNKVEKINIDTNDEFGEMSKSVNESITKIMQLYSELSQLMQTVDKYVIITETDENGIITYVSEAFCKISGYKKEELIGKPHSIIRHPDMPKELFEEMWRTIKSGKSWEGEIKNRKKDGGYFWVYTIITPKCTDTGASCGYTAIRFDITDKKRVEELTKTLEEKVKERTKELENRQKLINSILNSQESMVITSDGKQIITANKAFFEFFEINDVKEFFEKYGPCICDSFEEDVPDDYIKKYMEDGTLWIDYILKNPNKRHKVIIKKNNEPHIFTISVDTFEFENKKYITASLTDITELEKVKKHIEELHQHTKQSIEFASLIQTSLLPKKREIDKHFKDDFIIWKPKDIVGGDIYLFETLRNENECLLMVIDCTGHGVPGAFVTMIVKAIEREIVKKLQEDKLTEISPAKILGYFNNAIKRLLKQEDKNSKSNAGFDGGIIYYNRNEQILKFAGAETPLFYVEDGELKIIKGDRYSVGYKTCEFNHKYKEHVIKVKEGMKFYITTDGFIDQNGGKKGLPFGKKRFKKLIEEVHNLPMSKQKEIFLNELEKYKQNEEQNDDITVVGFEIDKRTEIYEIFDYEGIITQNVISTIIDNIESKVKDISMLSKLSTVVIEILQNIMHYSKSIDENSTEFHPYGHIKITKFSDTGYKIIAKNVISLADKDKIEPKLNTIMSMNEKEIKKKYRELRRSGEHSHEKGGGIGFYEIAKIATHMSFKFEQINKNKYFFIQTITIEKKKK